MKLNAGDRGLYRLCEAGRDWLKFKFELSFFATASYNTGLLVL